MSSMLVWDHVKISENSCSSDKELTSSCKREFPKLTCFSMSRPFPHPTKAEREGDARDSIETLYFFFFRR